jgi:hypothetical protein
MYQVDLVSRHLKKQKKMEAIAEWFKLLDRNSCGETEKTTKETRQGSQWPNSIW